MTLVTLMDPRLVELNIPLHLRDLLFGKPRGIAYREVLQNYNIEIIVPENPKLPICFKGYYPDIEYGPRKMKRYVAEVQELEFRSEIIIGKMFAGELKNKLRVSLEQIEIVTESLIKVFDSFLVIYNLSEENIDKARMGLRELFDEFIEFRRKQAKKRREAISEEYQFVEEIWFAKDMRRPAHNVI